MEKVGKHEILRHYRIMDFKTTEDMLEQIALKKGLTQQQVTTDPKTKKKQKKQVGNQEDAARRVIRDFLNNRITYFSKVM